MVFLWPGLPKKIWEFWAPSHPVQKKPQGRLRCFPAGVLLSKIPWGGSGENLGCKHRTLRPGTLWPNHPGERPPESGRTRVGCAEPFLHPWKHPTERSRNGSKTVQKRFENGSNFRKGFEKGSKRVRKRFEFSKRVRKGFENGSKTVRKRFETFSEPFWNSFWIEFSKRVRKGFEKGSKRVRKRFEFSKRVRKGFEKGSKTVRKRFENGSRPFSEPFWNPFWMPRVTCQEPFSNLYGEPFQNRFRTVFGPFPGHVSVFRNLHRAVFGVFWMCWSDLAPCLVVRIARPTTLAISHRECSHRRPDRNGSPNHRHFASLDLKINADFSHRRIFAEGFPGICFTVAHLGQTGRRFCSFFWLFVFSEAIWQRVQGPCILAPICQFEKIRVHERGVCNSCCWKGLWDRVQSRVPLWGRGKSGSGKVVGKVAQKGSLLGPRKTRIWKGF